MARRKPPTQTLDDLIDASGMSLGSVATAAKVDPRSLWKLRQGLVDRPRSKTVAGLAAALGVDTARVRAAIDASRRAAQP